MNWDKPMKNPSGWCEDFTKYHGLPQSWLWPDIYEYLGLGRYYVYKGKREFKKDYLKCCELMDTPLVKALL